MRSGGVPSHRLHLALVLAALTAALQPSVAIALAALLLLLGAIDALAARRLLHRAVELRVDAPSALSQLEPASAQVRVENRGERPLRLKLALDLAPEIAAQGSERAQELRLGAHGLGAASFGLLARERGRHAIAAVHLRLLGPLSLWWWQQGEPAGVAVDVLPAFARERRRRHPTRLRESGLLAVKSRGDRGEFESLREYARGDDPRRLDWKATARRATLIVRNHQDERSQNLMLVVDAGRLMLDRVDGLRRIDWAVAAAAALADATLQWRDHAGVMVFSDTIHALLPPGQHPPDRIPHLLAAVQARPVEPDYPRALVTLARELKRRSLIVLLSDVIDAEVSAPVAAHVRQLARRHLPVFVALRHPGLDAQSTAPVRDALSLDRRAAAIELLLARRKALESMRRGGIQVLDTLPAGSLQATVDHYVRIKQRGAL